MDQASEIWPHGRWRFDFAGQANHAGTTRMEDRRDPMLTYAMTALAANKQARLAGQRATFGRIAVEPQFSGIPVVASDRGGLPEAVGPGGVLIDPAAHGGHRETDLAMLALFGAPHLEEILAGYQEAHPLRDGAGAGEVALIDAGDGLPFVLTCRAV